MRKQCFLFRRSPSPLLPPFSPPPLPPPSISLRTLPALVLPPLSDLNYIALWVGSLGAAETEREEETVVRGRRGGSPLFQLRRERTEEGSSSSSGRSGRLEVAYVGRPDWAQHLHERRGRTTKCFPSRPSGRGPADVRRKETKRRIPISRVYPASLLPSTPASRSLASGKTANSWTERLQRYPRRQRD